jgi:hypothetical protein
MKKIAEEIKRSSGDVVIARSGGQMFNDDISVLSFPSKKLQMFTIPNYLYPSKPQHTRYTM